MKPVKKRIMAPGPVEVPPEVNAVAALQIPHHRTSEFRNALKAGLDGLKRLFGTNGAVIPLASSGTGAMEACVTGLFSPGDAVLVTVCGNFSQRWAELAEAYGLVVNRTETAWGEPVDPKEVAAKLAAHPEVAGVFTTFSETSTGVENDIESIGKVVRGTKAVLVVDGISGVGALPFHMDAWGVDALAVGSQKGLMLPPGLAAVALSDRARSRVAAAKTPSFYFSLKKALKSLEGEPLPDTPFTPAVSLLLQLRRSLELIEAEGRENVWKRVAVMGEATRAAVKALGLKLLAPRGWSNVVTSVDCADGPDASQVVKRLQDDYGISIIGGQGKLKGRIFRIGTVGHVDEMDVLAVIAALEMVLVRMGHGVKLGAGVAAAQEVFLKAGG